MASTPELHEAAPPPFDRAACLHSTLGDANPYQQAFVPVAQRAIAVRYLPEGMHENGYPNAIHATLEEWIAELDVQSDELTDERLEELLAASQQRRDAFGPELLRRAQELADQPNARGLLRTRHGAPREDGHEHSWDVVIEDGQAELIIATGSPTEATVIDLDEFARLDPAFLRQRIQEFHLAVAQQSMAAELQHGLFLHQLSEEEVNLVIPEYLRQLARLPSEQRSVAARWIRTFYGTLFEMAALEPVRHTYYLEVDRLDAQRLEVQLPDGRYAFTGALIRHRRDCGAEPYESQAYYETLHALHRDLADLLPETSGLQFSVAMEPLLARPSKAVLGPRADIATATQKIQEGTVAQDMIERFASLEHVDEVLQGVQRSYPHYYDALVNTLVPEAASLDAAALSERLEAALRTLRPSAIDVLAPGRIAERVADTLRHTPPEYRNGALSTLLTIVSSKLHRNAPPYAWEKGERLQQALGRRAEEDELAMWQLAGQVRNTLTLSETQLAEARETLRKNLSILTAAGISELDLAAIEAMARGSRGTYVDADKERFDFHHAYDYLFRAVVLHRQGAISVHEPAVVTFIERAYLGLAPRTFRQPKDFSALLTL